MAALTFATLGPAGTNHEFVSRKYIDFHGLSGAGLTLVDTADDALAGIAMRDIDYFILCAVHPDTPRVVGQSFGEAFVVDAFISPSLPLAVLSRRDVDRPRSIGLLHPATTSYVDTSRWESVIEIQSGTLHTVAKGLLAATYDSALVYRSYADLYPEGLRVDQSITSPDDAWLVLGPKRTYAEPIQAWRDGPISRQFAELLSASSVAPTGCLRSARSPRRSRTR